MIRERFDALAESFRQTVHTQRQAPGLFGTRGEVESLDPPEDLDEYYETYETTELVQRNLDQFVSDVVEPGYRVEADSEETVEWLENEWLPNCAILGGEKNRDFLPFLAETDLQRWVRGTALIEHVRPSEDAEELTGMVHIRPETVYPQVHEDTNILVAPDETDIDDVTLTPRNEAAAYIQFDNRSVVGRRDGGFDNDEIALSQNDVTKIVRNVGIGGGEAEDGIFGTSVIEPIADEVAGYKQIKRDNEQAIQSKAYGIWSAQFNKEVHEIGPQQVEITEWEKDEQDDWVDDADSLEPGGILGHDGSIELDRWEGEVADLEYVLDHYVDAITAPLPAPKYAVGFEENINQFVSNQQEERYEMAVSQERDLLERAFTPILEEAAETHGYDTSGLQLKIEPEEDDSPVRSLSSDEIDKLLTYAKALNELAGPSGGPATLIDMETLLTDVAQLPEDTAAEMASDLGSSGEGAPAMPDAEDEEAMQEFWRLMEE